MSEPSREKSVARNNGFQLDKDSNRVTMDQIKSYLNDGLMKGKVPSGEFIDNMLDVANKNLTGRPNALHALAISLGDLHFSSMMANGDTCDILSQGRENKVTQGVAGAITSKHIENLRKFYVQNTRPLFAEEAYLLSLFYAPGSVTKEDMEVLCKDLKGEPPGLFVSTKPGISTYYPKKILDVMVTTKEVIQKRPELVDATVIKDLCDLPRRIETGNFLMRPVYDRDISKGELKAAADHLREIL